MSKSYIEIAKEAKYKLAGNGARNIGMLLDAFKDIDPMTDADTYGTGKLINDFEAEIAEFLGKEKAVFFPTGTMAQQIATRMWSDATGTKKIAYHPLCHLEIHEKDAIKVLHHIDPVLLGAPGRLFTLEDLKAVNEPLACLLIELPQREIGGQLPTWEELVEISEYCKAQNIRLHLDGARLFEALPYYNKSAKEICALFDSVYISFYKGLGGIAGAILAGNTAFMEEAKIWKRRHGGDLISLYPYIVNARYSFNKRAGEMKKYWQNAIAVAERLNMIQGVKTIPEVPVCNMFHVYFDFSKDTLEKILTNIAEAHDLVVTMNIREISANLCMSELYFGDSFSLIPQEVLDGALEQLQIELR